jgi:hypothetical protein
VNVFPSRTALIGLACALAAACAGPSGAGAARRGLPPATSVTDPPAVVLARFVDALEAGRWAQAGELLSARWRLGYTPSRLQADYAGAGPMAREAAARVQAELRAGTPLQVEDGRAWLAVAGGRALLVVETAGWRVDALE